MKKSIKGLTLASAVCLCISSVLALAACGETQTQYNVIGTQDSYVPVQKPTSGAQIDDGIVLDGVLDESFYESKSWFVGHKNVKGREATLRTTAEIAPHGILFGIDVDEGFTISYSAGRPTAWNSGIEFYFAFGGETEPVDNLFEIDLTAHDDVNVRVWRPGIFNDGYLQYVYSFENAPAHAVKLKGGTIESGNCTGYTMELYLPYTLFGRDGRPEYINLNPGMITPLSDTDWVRDYYVFGGEFESSVCQWGKTEMYRFDKNGFVCNKLNITATGGTVTEKYRRDWAVKGDPVILEFAPEEGKALSSVKINGVEHVNDVKENVYRFFGTGDDLNVVAEFTQGNNPMG